MADGNNQIQTDTSIPNDKHTELNSETKGKKPPPHAFSDYTQYFNSAVLRGVQQYTPSPTELATGGSPLGLSANLTYNQQPNFIPNQSHHTNHPAYQTPPPFTGFSQITPTALLTPQNVPATNFSSNPYAYASSFHPLSGNMQGEQPNFTQHTNFVQMPNSEATPSMPSGSSSAVTTDRNPYSPNFNSSFVNDGTSHIEVSSPNGSGTHSGTLHKGEYFTQNGARFQNSKTKLGGKQKSINPSNQKLNQQTSNIVNISANRTNDNVNKNHAMKTTNNNHANPHSVPSPITPSSNQPNSSKNNKNTTTPFSYASMLTNKPVTNPSSHPPVQTTNATVTTTSSSDHANSSIKQDAFTVESTLLNQSSMEVLPGIYNHQSFDHTNFIDQTNFQHAIPSQQHLSMLQQQQRAKRKPKGKSYVNLTNQDPGVHVLAAQPSHTNYAPPASATLMLHIPQLQVPTNNLYHQQSISPVHHPIYQFKQTPNLNYGNMQNLQGTSAHVTHQNMLHQNNLHQNSLHQNGVIQNNFHQNNLHQNQMTNQMTTTQTFAVPDEKMKGKRDLNPNKKKRITTMKKIIKSERETRRHIKIEQLSRVLAPQEDVPTLPEQLIEKIADCMMISTEGSDDLDSSNLTSNVTTNVTSNVKSHVSSVAKVETDEAEVAPSKDEQVEQQLEQDTTYENTVGMLPKQFPAIHSRRFREYCNQVLDASLDSNCIKLIECIKRRQDKQMKQQREREEARKAQSQAFISRDFNQGPKLTKSIVMGLREVTKHAKAGNLKLVVVAPNLEKVQTKGGLDDAVEKLKTACNLIQPGAGKNDPTPIAFALSRIALGRALNRSVPISTIGIRSVVGFEKEYKKVIDLLEASKDRYASLCEKYLNYVKGHLAQQNNDEFVEANISKALSVSTVLSVKHEEEETSEQKQLPVVGTEETVDVMRSSKILKQPVTPEHKISKRIFQKGHKRNDSALTQLSLISNPISTIGSAEDGRGNWSDMMKKEEGVAQKSTPSPVATPSSPMHVKSQNDRTRAWVDTLDEKSDR